MKKASIIAIVLIMVFAAMGMYAENTKVKVTTRTWVYEEPKSTAKKLAIVEIDQLFEYVNEQTDWYRVKLENGDEGFIRKAHSDLVASDETDMGKSDTIPETTDDWVCTTCNTTASGNFCKNCGAAKPSDSWKCQNCGNNATGNFCSNCGAPKASDVWVCPNCNNTATGKFCSNCGTAKPSNVWTCPACGSTNNGKFCINCGAAYSSKQTAVETPSITTPAPTSDDTLNTGISAQENILFESATAAELLSNAKEHVRTSSKPSPDKYTYYIQDYIGLNLSSIGYTSLGGDRFDRYGASLLKIYPLTLDGTFVDIEDDDILSQYVVVGQNIAPNTELNLTYKKDSKGKEYSNLIDYQNVESIDLLVVRIDGKSKDIIIPYEPVAIKAAPDRYTNYVRNYVGKNLSTVGYTSLGGDRMDEYHAAHIKICPVTADGTYIDIEDEDLLQQYVVVGQNIAPNTEMKLVYRKDSKGNEYDNLIDFCSIETIDLQVVRIDGALYNDPVKYDPIPIKVSPNKYTWYMRNYVGKNLLSIGYTSMGGKRMDEYGDARLELVFITPDHSVIDIDDTDALARYAVVSQDIAPNSEIAVTYLKDSKGNEYDNLVDTMSYKKITLTLQKVNTIPEEKAVPISDSNITIAATAAPVETHIDGQIHTYREFQYVIQSDNTAVIVGYNGTGSTVTIPSDFDDYDISGIGPSVFENHSEITTIIMWADPVFISERAFMGCTKLKDISISSDCKSIGPSAFEGCTKLSSAILWGDPEIGARAFFGCTSLKEISIGNDTKLIGESAFEGCTSLKSVLIWGGTNIGNRAFWGCTSIKELSIDSDTEYIGDYAFYGCTSLKEVTIWGSKTKIGNEAFGNCPNLKKFNQW